MSEAAGLPSLSTAERETVRRLVDALAGLPAVEAVVLGGSHARGVARSDSDVDLGLLYSEAAAFPLAELRALAEGLHDGGAPVVTTPYEWGPWANGGAWLTVGGRRFDLLYRSLERLDRVIADARAGRFEIHHGQQPPYGFFGPTLLGELRVAVPLFDRRGRLAERRARAADYPDPLRRAVVQSQLWAVEFGMAAFAGKSAARGDVYGTAGCLARFAHQLVLALFALNREYPVNDKTALAEVDGFAAAPERFGARVEAILAGPGAMPAELGSAVSAMDRLFRETAALAGDLYAPGPLP